MRAFFLTFLVACGSDPVGDQPFLGPTDGGLAEAAALDASKADTAVPDAGDATVPLPPRPYDWVQLISTGQSLSVGSQGVPASTELQPYQNMVLSDSSTDPKFDNDGDVLSLVPMVSPIRTRAAGAPASGAYPNNINGETVSEGLGNQLSAIALAREGRDYVSIATNVGQGGRPLSVIEKQAGAPYPAKPTDPLRQAYWASMYETTHLKELAIKAGKKFGVGGVFLTHGESDALLENATYEAGVIKLATDYDTDTRAITGQTTPVLLFASQQGTYPSVADAVSPALLALWSASVKDPARVVCVGPKYQYEYSSDLVHLPAPAYERVGEKYAEAYYQTVALGKRWRPLEPVQVTRTGKIVTVSLYVPFPPLSWESAFAPAHQLGMHPWRNGRGFEVATVAAAGQLSTKLAIASAELDGASAVKITLVDEPAAGTALVVRHAMVQDVGGAQGGLAEGRHGQLRDSDPFVPRDARAIDVIVKNGSTQITASVPGAFARQTQHDRVTLPGMSTELVVIARAGDTLTLSSPVSLPDATVKARFMSDQRNYLVHFELPVP
jgi:hypothetical protein